MSQRAAALWQTVRVLLGGGTAARISEAAQVAAARGTSQECAVAAVMNEIKALLQVREADSAVKVLQSRVGPGAGCGVFAQRDIASGAVVALYPGTCVPLPPPELASSADGMLPMPAAQLEAESEYVINLEAGGFIDGAGEDSVYPALAHLVNHPPATARPNVATFSFTWPESLRSSAPNRLHRGAWLVDGAGVAHLVPPAYPLPGIAFFALRPIQAAEELLLDYRLRPPHPTWYTPVR